MLFDRSGCPRPVALAAGKQSPDDACVAVCQGDHGYILRPSRKQPVEPRIGAWAMGAHNAPCAVDEELAQVRIAPLGDPEQAWLAPGAVLPRNHAQPGGKAPSVIKDMRISRGGNRSARRQGSNPGDLGYPLASLALAMPGADAAIELGDLLVQPQEL